GTVTSPLRIAGSDGTIYGVRLVSPSDPNASKFIIQTAAGSQALKAYTSQSYTPQSVADARYNLSQGGYRFADLLHLNSQALTRNYSPGSGGKVHTIHFCDAGDTATDHGQHCLDKASLTFTSSFTALIDNNLTAPNDPNPNYWIFGNEPDQD